MAKVESELSSESSSKSDSTTTDKTSSTAEKKPDPSTEDWQASKCDLRERFKYIFENKISCDVQFIVGSRSNFLKVGAHKLVLSAGSSVFFTMFNEKWSADHKEVEVADVEPVAFTDLLRYLYYDHILLKSETVSAVLHAAKKYAVLSLENKCVEFLLNGLSPDNAFSTLIQGRRFNAQGLVDACLEVIADNTMYTLENDDFLNIDNHTLCLVLDRSDLRISEIALFEAVLRWSKAACEKKKLPVTHKNQRSALNCTLRLLRFPLMKSDDFASKVVTSGILSEDEIISVSMYFIENSKPKDCIFIDEPRRSFYTAKRFQSIVSGGTYDSSSLHELSFESNTKITLLGFGLYGSPDCPAFYPVDVTLFEGKNPPAVVNNTTPPQSLCTFSGTYDGSKEIFSVMFPKPVELTASKPYLLQVKIQGKYLRYGCNGYETVEVNIGPDQDPITFSFNSPKKVDNEQDRGNKTDQFSGQIPEIFFEV